MVSTACYPYPVNETTRRSAMRPHIYSPSESHTLPRHIMYPHTHPSPSPSYIYSAYDPYHSKNSWASAAWPSYYSYPLSSSLPESTINPKVTILPPQPVLVSDIDTPSSLSSDSIPTPTSPFARHTPGEQPMEFDEFDDDEDYVDSDFADEMEVDEHDAPVYAHTKSTSALAGALGDTPLPAADRRLSASVPYPSASRARQSASPAHVPYTRHHASATSLASPYASAARLPILQPQPIRPIPPIPIAELAAADDALPLLCQPVSDAVRYQLGRASTPSDLAHDATFCPADGTCSVGKSIYPCGYVGWR